MNIDDDDVDPIAEAIRSGKYVVIGNWYLKEHFAAAIKEHYKVDYNTLSKDIQEDLWRLFGKIGGKIAEGMMDEVFENNLDLFADVMKKDLDKK